MERCCRFVRIEWLQAKPERRNLGELEVNQQVEKGVARGFKAVPTGPRC